MPYIMNPADLGSMIGARCGGSAVDSANETMLFILGLLLPRLEDLMSVASLTYGETTDTFQFFGASTDAVPDSDGRLRLSNAYVENSEDNPVTILDPNGDAVTDFLLDERYGVITLTSWIEGRYTVAYYAGLTATVPEVEGDPSYFENVPAWMQGLVVELMMMYYRTNQQSLKLPDNVSYAEIVYQLDKEIKRRIYSRFQRPRDVEFPIRSVRTDGMLT